MRPGLAGSRTHTVSMLEFQNPVDIPYDYLMYPQEKPAEKYEKYMTLLPANRYKE